MRVKLRQYQQAAFDAARVAVRQGARRVLIVAPTGSGKTVLAAALMEMVRAKGRRANFVVDRLSLIDQTSAVFSSYGLPHGVIQAEHPNFHPDRPIQVCSAQTIARRIWPESAVDVFDEAHVLHKAHKVRMQSRESIVIGLTATPFTKGLGQWFDALVNVTTTRALIQQGWLAPYRIFACQAPDMADVPVKSTGEWAEKPASERALQIVGDVVAEYKAHGQQRKFICSAVDVAHVRELELQFQAAGIHACAYTYQENGQARAEVVQEFRKSDSSIRGLITVTAASRGFDVPDVSCIIMARPLRKSLAEHIQLFGRGLRMAEGKKDCLVLDHSGNCERFFAQCEAFFECGMDALHEGKKGQGLKQAFSNKAEPARCPHCRAVHKKAKVCPHCGHEYRAKAQIEHVPGTLKELLKTYGEGCRLGNAAARRVVTDALWPQIVGYTLQQRQGEAARKMALAIYREITSAWPAARFEDTEAVEPTREVLGKIRSNQIRWAHARKRREAAA